MQSVIQTAISDLVATATAVLTTNLPLIFGVFGALIALALIVRYVRKYIGRK